MHDYNDRDKCKNDVIFACKLNNLPDNGHVVLKIAVVRKSTTINSKPVVCSVGLLLNCNHVRYTRVRIKHLKFIVYWHSVLVHSR